MKNSILYIIVSIVIFVSCNEDKKHYLTNEEIQKQTEQAIQINKALVKAKSDSIKAYIKDNDLSMLSTGTGMYYKIFPSGNTDTIKTGDMIKYSYSVGLLNEPVCYSSEKSGLKTAKVGQAGVESGLEEAFLLLHKGDSARFILPPHLAWGLQGDLKKIPPFAILDYRITIIDHKKVH